MADSFNTRTLSENRTTFSRRRALQALPALAVFPSTAGEAALAPDPTALWSAFVASVGDLVPPGTKLRVFGNADGFGLEMMQTIMQPVTQQQPDRLMAVEWTIRQIKFRNKAGVWKVEGPFEIPLPSADTA